MSKRRVVRLKPGAVSRRLARVFVVAATVAGFVLGAGFVAQLAARPAFAAGKGHGPFNGRWSSVICRSKKDCARFDLNLQQKGKNICGMHLAVDTDSSGDWASRPDDGDAQSIVGTVVGNEAVVVIRSGRDDSRFLAKITLINPQKIRWRNIGLLPGTKTGDSVDANFPVKAELRKKEDDPDFSRVGEGDKNYVVNCDWPDD